MSAMPEVRPIMGYGGAYGIAADGSVWSLRNGSRLATFLDRGMVRVSLFRDGKAGLRCVSTLWRESWGPDAKAPGKRPSGRVVGSRHGRARLDEATVIEARRLRREGWTERRLAEWAGVSPATMHYALAGATWGHVP